MGNIYRKQWKSEKGTGWNFRLDIMPYDSFLSDPVVTLSGAEANAIEIGAIESSYDALPYGLKSPDQMTLRLVSSKLPLALQNYLRAKVSYGTININTWSSTGYFKNTFLYYSDRGTNGSTWTLEFVGTPAKISGMSYKKEAGAYATTIELVDSLYDAMVGMPMSKIENSNWAGNYHTVLYDVGFPGANRADAFHTARVEDTGWSTGFFVEDWATVFSKIKPHITSELVRQTCRTYNQSVAAIQNASDSTAEMPNLLGNCVEFYQCSGTYPRTIGPALTTSTAKLVTRVIERDSGATVGGVVSSRDEVSWARYETAWDWYKDLCETFAAKVSYRPVYNAGGGSPYISYVWYVEPIKSPYSSVVTASLDDALDYPEITETEDAVAKAEVRTDLFSEGNTTQWIVNSGVVRADKQFTAQVYCHNLPVTLDVFKASGGGDKTRADVYSIGLFQTNRIVYESGGQCFLAHPTVKIYEGPANSTVYKAIDPGTSVDLGEQPANPLLDGNANQVYNLWVNAVQKYGGLPYAIGRHVTSIFGTDNIASFEAEFRITDYPGMTIPAGSGQPAIGDVIDLSSSSAASDLSHLSWSKAVVTSVTSDLQANKSKIKYVLVP